MMFKIFLCAFSSNLSGELQPKTSSATFVSVVSWPIFYSVSVIFSFLCYVIFTRSQRTSGWPCSDFDMRYFGC